MSKSIGVTASRNEKAKIRPRSRNRRRAVARHNAPRMSSERLLLHAKPSGNINRAAALLAEIVVCQARKPGAARSACLLGEEIGKRSASACLRVGRAGAWEAMGVEIALWRGRNVVVAGARRANKRRRVSPLGEIIVAPSAQARKRRQAY